MGSGVGELIENNIVGAFIQTLMHWIPLELHSEACLHESSTRMGDLLGSPHVTPLLPFSYEISMIYVCIRYANRAIGANANIFRTPRPKLWLKTPFLPSLPIHSSKGCSEPTIVILASRLMSRSNANPCTKTRVQSYRSKAGVNFKRDMLSDLDKHPRYSHNNTSVKTNFSPYFLLSSTTEVVPQSYHIRGLGRNNMTGVIIPALMHRIPSELRS
ncbi:hypothetical protein CK203_054789 [Vitis vinifera]|uniref:Uncharacterized protein n=1 Tax=Vitis vinifera TaxID=29760 RepID=A0A438GIS9_VITVI|nr:hypothetical protein CK203_054789 [Vitis vinifera]